MVKRLIWRGEGRSEETLRKFFDFFDEKRAKHLRGICCNMWMPYIDVIEQGAPNAIVVSDTFLIIRHRMNAVDRLRREEIREK